MKLHSFQEFLNESKSEEIIENPLNENAEVTFVSDKRIKDEKDLFDYIEKHLAKAFNTLLSDNGIDYNPVTAKMNVAKRRVELDSKPLMGKDLGIMKYGFYEVWINSFGGGQLPQFRHNENGEFEFHPYIWFNIHYSYHHGSPDIGSQGSNGCSLYLPGERTSNAYYVVLDEKFYKDSEARRMKF
jgi:hypothetical protein